MIKKKTKKEKKLRWQMFHIVKTKQKKTIRYDVQSIQWKEKTINSFIYFEKVDKIAYTILPMEGNKLEKNKENNFTIV